MKWEPVTLIVVMINTNIPDISPTDNQQSSEFVNWGVAEILDETKEDNFSSRVC